VVADGKLYGIPSSAKKILVLDLQTEAVSGIKVCSGRDKWSGGVAAADGKLYGIPYSAEGILELDPFLLVDLAAAVAELGPLTLQCLSGSKFEVGWPAEIKCGASLDLRKLAAEAHPETALGAADFQLVAVAATGGGDAGACGSGGAGGASEPLDVSVLDADMLRGMVRGLIPTTLTVVFRSPVAAALPQRIASITEV
jgi:hypothetical protein